MTSVPIYLFFLQDLKVPSCGFSTLKVENQLLASEDASSISSHYLCISAALEGLFVILDWKVRWKLWNSTSVRRNTLNDLFTILVSKFWVLDKYLVKEWCSANFLLVTWNSSTSLNDHVCPTCQESDSQALSLVGVFFSWWDVLT